MVHHQHSGKLLATHHTSYASLVFLLIVSLVLVVGMSWSAWAAPANPQSGSVGLTGIVKGPPPATPAVILNPSSGQLFNATPVTVSGTCPLNTYVSITRNNAFAGTAPCQDDGRFSLLIDLFDGANSLVAKVSDALGQTGPDSAVVNVSYAPLAAPTSSGAGKQLFLNMSTSVVAGTPGQPISRSVIIVGGAAPYAVSWDFGDDATALMSVTSEGQVTATHTYARPGVYRVIVQVRDAAGSSAFLQFVTIVNGPAATIGSTSGSGNGAVAGQMVAAVPILLFGLILVIAFWLGERREASKLRRQHLLTT